MPAAATPQDRRTSTKRDKDGTPSKARTPTAKELGLGNSNGVHDTAFVKNKVLQWQTLALPVTVNTEPSPGSDKERVVVAKELVEAPETPNSKDISASPAKQEDNGSDTERKKVPNTSRKPRHNELDEDLRMASAPKKRVVSDSHWRKQQSQSPPKNEGVRTGAGTAKSRPTAWVRPSVKQLSDSKTKDKENEKEKEKSKAKPQIPAPIKSLVQTGAQVLAMENPVTGRRKSVQKYGSGGEEKEKNSLGQSSATDIDGEPITIRTPSPHQVYSSKNKHNRKSRDASSSDEILVLVEEDAFAKRRSKRRIREKSTDDLEDTITDPEHSPNLDVPDDFKSRRRRRPSRGEDYNMPEEKSSPRFETTDEPRTSRRKSQRHKQLENRSDDNPAQPIAESGPKIYSNRVEAWLGSTPDPFVEDDSKINNKESKRNDSKQNELQPPDTACEENQLVSKALHSRESSKDQRHNRRRRTKSPETVTEINTTVDDQTGDSSIVNFEPVTDEFAVESPTTPTLRRRGAKKTSQPTKYRYDQNTITGEDDCSSSAPSSSVDPLTIDVPSINCDLRRNDLPFKRQFPSTGKRLSTIVSVETFQSKPNLAPSFISDGSERTAQLTAIIAEDTTLESGDSRDMHYTPSFIKRKRSSGSRMASDADLISVLSIPKAGGKSIVSARSIRTNRSRLATATVDDLLAELASDEQKYMRELRTLVDGVIPVLLTCVLSKSDSAVAAGLFSRTLKDKDDPNVTKPIVDMGIALERLKSLHKRIPTSDVDALLSWAQTAQRSYNDYLKAWRLGFQDVVISLAPASEDNVSKDSETGAWDAGLPRNEHGDILDSLGERVDVAYLLKRPLVRLKFLSKTFRGINFIRYSSKAEAVSNEYQALFLAARQRQDDERARLEDDAAANIDTTRARDPKSLAPVQGVLIDPFRHVKARDPFDLHILHSSGQEIDCRVELVLRDDAPDRGSSGDVLLCEVGDKGRCLFFPPIQLSRISARAGNSNYELVAMIRGLHSAGQEWHELLTLKSNDDQTVMDWIKMLGSNPVPPRLTRAQSFMNKKIRPKSKQGDSLAIVTSSPTTSMKSRTPSPREVQVPIGEPAQSTAKTWGTETPEKDDIRRRSMDVSPTSPQSQETPRYDGEEYGIADSPPSPIEPLSRDDKTQHRRSSRRTSRPDSGTVSTPRSLNEAMMLAGTGSPTTLKRTRARRYRNTPSPTSGSLRGSNDHTPVKDHEDRVKSKPMMPRQDRADSAPPSTTGFSTIGSSVTGSSTTGSSTLSSGKSYSVWFPPSDVENDEEEQEGDDEDVTPRKPVRPQPHRRTSTVPSLDLPTIPKLRKTSQPITPVNESSSAHKELDFVQKRPLKDTPMSAPPKLQKSIESSKTPIKKEDKPPVPPPHRPSNAGELKSSNTPQFTPAWKQHRRSSSPLKHEYEPSTATETSASEESDESFYENDYSTTSESSEDDIEEDVSILGPLPPIQPRKVSPPNSLYTLGNGTLSPSQSASQSPYRTVPANSGKMTKAIACIFSWSDKGMWEQLHPEECSIVITPGLIEAFEMGANHSKPPPSQETGTDTKPERPLVAVELTPLVPLRRGTALDISIRSPPTSNSKLASSSNIMFRSRSPEECEALYQLINQSRINNITYIALQNARGSYAENTWGATMDRRNATRSTSGSTGSWWGTLSRSRSYRASSHRAASTTAASDSSVGTMQTAFSALRRFTSGGIFNVARSTITSREGSRSIGSGDSMFSGGSGSGSASGTSTPRASTSANAPPPMPLGITNTKIRLYVRESGNKWRDMGSARLSILMPSTSTPSRTAGAVVPGSPGTNSQGQKRIVVLGKTKGETLLDVTLGESSFERVARTGIAVSVWEDCMGPEGIVGTVGKTGGVSGARARVYMIQTKTEREAAYSFSLLGKLRY